MKPRACSPQTVTRQDFSRVNTLRRYQGNALRPYREWRPRHESTAFYGPLSFLLGFFMALWFALVLAGLWS